MHSSVVSEDQRISSTDVECIRHFDVGSSLLPIPLPVSVRDTAPVVARLLRTVEDELGLSVVNELVIMAFRIPLRDTATRPGNTTVLAVDLSRTDESDVHRKAITADRPSRLLSDESLQSAKLAPVRVRLVEPVDGAFERILAAKKSTGRSNVITLVTVAPGELVRISVTANEDIPARPLPALRIREDSEVHLDASPPVPY